MFIEYVHVFPAGEFPRQALKPSDTLARRFVYRCRAVPGAASHVGLTVAVDSLAAWLKGG